MMKKKQSSTDNSNINITHAQTVLAQLPQPCRYSPFSSGKYSTEMQLNPFGTDFGNGDRDKKFIQIDKFYPTCIANKKIWCNKIGHLSLTHDMSAIASMQVVDFILRCLLTEWGKIIPTNVQIGEQNVIELEWPMIDPDPIKIRIGPHGMMNPVIVLNTVFLNPVDMLCTFLQEDFALVTCKDGKNWISMLHVAQPHGWRPVDVIGKPFSKVHNRVPGMKKTNKKEDKIIDALINQGKSYVRFVWGYYYPPKGTTEKQGITRLPYIWVERQTTFPLPEANSFLFLIRTYNYSIGMINKDEEHSAGLLKSLQSMPEDVIRYKGYEDTIQNMIRIVKTTPADPE